MSSRILLLLVPGQCCLTKLLPFFYSTSKNNSGSSSCTPSSKASLLASTFASNSNLDDQESQPPLYPTSNLTMSPSKFSTRNVRKALLQLNTSKSSGSDGIPAIVLKSFAPELALSSTSFSIFPTILVFSLPLGSLPMFPYPQKGDKSDPSNYRLIAITSLISKTMETIITKQLLTFLNHLSDHQYGLRQARSTGDLLAYAGYAFYGESREISISKAFDHAWHKGLLAILPMFVLHHSLITWISSFLSDRSIAIRFYGYLSKPHAINSGVPQGSVISPVTINSVWRAIKHFFC